MAVSYGSSGVRSNKAAVATTDTVTPALPAGVAAGDLLVIFASSFRDATTFSADQSYVNTRQNTKIAILEKTAGGSEVAPTVTFGGLTVGDLISAVIMRFPGGAATKDWSNVTGAMSATTLPGPPLTVTDTGSVGVVIGYQPNDKTGATFTANSWTEREYSTTTTGTDGTHYVATQDGLASGSQTMPIWTWVGSLEYRAISFSVPPGTGNQTITGTLFSNSNTFFGATVSAGSVNIAGSLYSDADAFYGATVTANWLISGSLYSDPDTFYAAAVTASNVITGLLFTDPDTFFAATITADGATQAITGELFANDNAFFGATIALEAPAIPSRGGFWGGRVTKRFRDEQRDQLKEALRREAETIELLGDAYDRANGIAKVAFEAAGVPVPASIPASVAAVARRAPDHITTALVNDLLKAIATYQRQQMEEEEAMVLLLVA